VLLELPSDNPSAYTAIYRGFVAQFEVRKHLILFGKEIFGKPDFEPGGRRFESLRAHHEIKNLPLKDDYRRIKSDH
jgi:hypothetical protein